LPAAEEPEEMPLPSDPKTIFLGGLFILALIAAAYVVSEIVLPLVFAVAAEGNRAAGRSEVSSVARSVAPLAGQLAA
jgi:hypothetical protein